MEETRICKKCNTPKPIKKFALHTPSVGGRRRVCKTCCSQMMKDLALKNRQAGLCHCGKKTAPGRKQCATHIKRVTEAARKNRKRGLCHCGRPPVHGAKCERCASRNKNWLLALRRETLEAYGGKCQCPCGCSTDEPEFLNVDHINGGGGKQRAEVKCPSGRAPFYSWLRKHGFPKDLFRLLCWNCNCSRGVYGYCPKEL
jgi:hypothetical protein